MSNFFYGAIDSSVSEQEIIYGRYLLIVLCQLKIRVFTGEVGASLGQVALDPTCPTGQALLKIGRGYVHGPRSHVHASTDGP